MSEDQSLDEIKQRLRARLREIRVELGDSKQAFARRLGFHKTAIYKIEHDYPIVTVDWFMRQLVKLGYTPSQIGAILVGNSGDNDG